MKILMTWEMDSDPIHLHHLQLLAHHIRFRNPKVKISLATTQTVPASYLSVFDEIFVAARVQLKHVSDAVGILSNLSSLGWTAPDLRPWSFAGWSQIYDTYAPDLVIAEASPGALLSAVLKDVPVISSSNGHHQITQDELALNEHFPEFQAWLWSITGRTYAQVLSSRALVFSPSAADVQRPGMVFNVNPAQWPWVNETSPSADALIYGDIPGITDINHLLAENGFTSQRVNAHEAVNVERVRVVVGNYDRFSVSLAASLGCPYLGAKPVDRDPFWANRCNAAQICYRIESEDIFEALLHGARRKVITPASSPFVDLPLALGYFGL